MNQANPTPSFTSRIAYKDLRSAVDWLEKAFGFKTTMLATDPGGNVVHAEMSFGTGMIHVASEWENIKAPASIGGANTQNLCVNIRSGIEEFCERARAAGGVIIQEPRDQFHGDRTFRVVDPQGHVWSFSQRMREVSAAELETAVPGMKVTKFA